MKLSAKSDYATRAVLGLAQHYPPAAALRAEELAAEMTRFAGLPGGQVAAMGKAGRAWVEQDFAPAEQASRLLALYSSLRGRS